MRSIWLSLTLLIFVAPPSLSSDAPEIVMDVDGKPLTTTSSYLIYPATGGTTAGLTLNPPNASFSCPFYVSQAEGGIDDPSVLPARFFPVDSNASIKVSTDMNIDFNAVSLCPQSTVWRIGPAEGRTRFVEAGGVKGSPGVKTLANWFKIAKVDGRLNVYKFVFCPTVCSDCKVVCGELGVIRKGGRRLLGIAPHLQPLLVVFKEA